MAASSASRPKPQPSRYDEDFAKRAREATRQATERTRGKGR